MSGVEAGPAARALTAYAAALVERDWPGVRAALGDDLRVTLLHTGEVLDAERFLSLDRDYPGEWVLEVLEVVDGGPRAVLRTATRIGDQTWHAATFASAGPDGRLVEITEVWTDAVPPAPTPPDRSTP